MKHRALDLFLFLVVVIGGALDWQTGRERSRLSKEHARLARITGDPVVEDPSKVYIKAVETSEPMQFAWRVYYPPSYTQILSHRGEDPITSWSSSSFEFIARVVFRLDEAGLLRVYRHFPGGGSQSRIWDEGLAKLLRDHWDKLRVEQLGAVETAALGPNQPAILLRLTLPDELRAEARKNLSAYSQKRYVPVVYELNLGPHAAIP